jgi:ABC-2 type transport system permease protein
MKNYFKTTLVLMMSLLRRFMRDKVALFFTFLFPLLFLLVFGALNKGNENISFKVTIINHSSTKFASDFVSQAKNDKLFKIDKKIKSMADAKERMSRGSLDSIIELPKDFGKANKQGIPSGKLIVYYEASSAQTGQTLAGIMQQSLDQINKNLTGSIDPFVVEKKATKTSSLTAFDYVFSGLMGYTILSLGVFGMANGFPADKKNGVLKRLRATPLHASQLILATALEYLVVGVMALSIMFVVGLTVFDFNMRGDYFNLIAFSLISIIVMFGFGLAIGGWAKNENQSAPLSNLIAFPMMFLSGVFFPRFMMPDWLQNITGYVPLTPIVDGLRYITTEGQTLLQLGSELLILGVWAIVIYGLAIKIFRWE